MNSKSSGVPAALRGGSPISYPKHLNTRRARYPGVISRSCGVVHNRLGSWADGGQCQTAGDGGAWQVRATYLRNAHSPGVGCARHNVIFIF